ncbi:hypothetical protein BH20CHL7_BH20CHL7_14950 [soil metagenome]
MRKAVLVLGPNHREAATLGANPTTGYGWDAVPDRTSVQIGAGTGATTAYDAANRPTSGSSPAATYSHDDDGRLTARPGQRPEWDALGRLVRVRPATGNSTIAAYTYDPLDRLRMADYGGNSRIRFRYVGLTTSVVGWLDDQTGTVTRHVANGWRGERLADWTGSGSDLRVYGTNGHSPRGRVIYRALSRMRNDTACMTRAMSSRNGRPSRFTPFRRGDKISTPMTLPSAA